jgi:hypothetical protein
VEVSDGLVSDPDPEAQAMKKIPRRAEERTGVILGRRVSMRDPWVMRGLPHE